MRKIRNSHGFTMAEMLIVVAIILVLAGVAFIAVQNHQRSMAQLERNTIAKELFVAAQNHLTMAESEGYPVESASGNYFGTVASDATNSDGSTEDTSTSSSEDDAPTESEKKPTNVYYIIGPSSGNILDLMLPFGSIDETVRAGGSYLIRYQTNPAIVLDVFYVTKSGSPDRFNKDGGIVSDTYTTLMEKWNNNRDSGYVLGYYGGEEALTSGEIILAPTVEIHNEERLTVTVTDLNNNNADPTKRNANAALKLIITGESSGAKMAIALDSTSTINTSERFSYSEADLNYTVILDDITTTYDSDTKDGLHFAHLNAYAQSEGGVIEFWKDGGNTLTFLPGENITVQAVAYSNTALTNIAYSSARTTNSLFADPGETSTTAMIANFRHLENLDATISNLDKSLGFTGAEQIEDMIWKDYDNSTLDFIQVIKADKDIEKVKIYRAYDETGGADDSYLPVTPSMFVKGSGTTEDSTQPLMLSYEGNGHTITGVTIDVTGDAGLFGSMSTNSAVANLKLVDFIVNGNNKTEETTGEDEETVTTATGSNVGTLAGSLTGCTVTNVVAYNTTGFEIELAKTDATKTTVSTTSGSAGGLIGSIAGGTSVSKSAAALIVSATGGNAGGLIGTSDGGSVSGCYSGGHTIKSGDAVIYSDTAYNVTATATDTGDDTTGGVAGGLIGAAGATKIDFCYSTCSATGTTVGGLIGTGSGDITGSYCTGRVLKAGEDGKPLTGIKAGAFAAEYTGTAKDCGFFEIVNEYIDDTVGYDYLTAIPKLEGSDGTKPGIEAIDKTADTFNTFCGGVWADAEVYNPTLKTYYGEGSGDDRVAKYNLKTVEQLGADIQAEVKDADGNVTTPADFVATHHGDWPAPEIFVVNTK